MLVDFSFFLLQITLVRSFFAIGTRLAHSAFLFASKIFTASFSFSPPQPGCLPRGVEIFSFFAAIITNKQNFNDRLQPAGVECRPNQRSRYSVVDSFSFLRGSAGGSDIRDFEYLTERLAGPGWRRTRDLSLKGRVSHFSVLRNHRVNQFHAFFLTLTLILILIPFDASRS